MIRLVPMSLRIGFVFDDTLDVLDGVQQHIVTLGQELARRGHEVHYLVGETHDSPVPNTHPMSRNVMVRFNGNRMRIPLPANTRHIREVLDEYDFDILHVQAPYSRMRIPLPANTRHIREVLDEYDFDILHVQAPYSPFMAARVLDHAHQRTGVVATYHIASADLASRIGGRALGLVNMHSHRRVDEVIAVSQIAAQYAEQTAHVRGVVIPNPVDVDRFAGASPTHAIVQGDTASAHSSEGPLAVFLGRFVPRKGAELLLDAVEYGEEHDLFPRGFHVRFAGKGPLLDECRERASHLRTPIEFLGFVEEEEKPKLLASADVAIFPATGGESFGIVLLEAIASNAGVTLAGDNPGYRSTMLDDEDSLFPVSGTDRARILAERIARALTDEPWAADLHAREAGLLDRYNVRTVTDQVEQVYGQAMAARHAD